MGLLKSKSLTGKYFIGVGMALLLGVGAYMTSQKNIVPGNGIQGTRNIATFLKPNEFLAQLTAADRSRLATQYLERRCTNEKGEDVSCGYHSWPNGVPMDQWNPQDHYMAKIPPGTKVQVKIECDPKTRKFYTNVYFPHICPNEVYGNRAGRLRIVPQTSKCGEFYFQNPYEPYLQDAPTAPFSDKKQNWLTSPGVFNRDDMTNLTGKCNTENEARTAARLPPGQRRCVDYVKDMKNLAVDIPNGGSNAVTEHHVVSDAKEWEGAKMTNTIWLKGDFAIHGSAIVTGRPESKGCIRLQNDKRYGFKAQGLYMLTKRVGTQNISYSFSGYGPPDPAIGGRPACSLSSEEFEQYEKLGRVVAETKTQAEERRAASIQQSNNAFKNLGRFFNNIFRRRGSRTQGTSPSSTR